MPEHRFHGDVNWLLQRIQWRHFATMVHELFYRSRQRYLFAAVLLGVETDLSKQLEKVWSCDPHIFEEPYAKIASFYRFKHDLRGQMQLPFDGLSHEERLRENWREFFDHEVGKLTENHEAVRCIVSAVACYGTQRGDNACSELIAILHERYGMAWDLACGWTDPRLETAQ